MAANTAEQIYIVFWILVTIGMSIYCIYEYALDKDATKVGFRSFQTTEDDKYPSISICFDKPFDPFKISKISSKIFIFINSLWKNLVLL